MGATSFSRAAVRVFDLSLGEMLWSRRTVFMALVVGLPIVLAVVLRLLVAIGGPAMMNGASMSGPVVFGLMIWAFFVRFSVPVLAVFYGTSLIADEVDDKTLTYLFTRPVPRGAVLAGKYLAYLVCTVFVMVPSLIVVWLLVVPIRGNLGNHFGDLVTDLGLVTLGLAVYGAFFAWVGAALRRPLMFGLIYVFGWEWLCMALPGYMKRLTIAYYLEGLVPHTMPTESPVAILQTLFRDPPTVATSLTGLILIGAVCLVMGMRTVGRREYVLDQ